MCMLPLECLTRGRITGVGSKTGESNSPAAIIHPLLAPNTESWLPSFVIAGDMRQAKLTIGEFDSPFYSLHWRDCSQTREFCHYSPQWLFKLSHA
ncbi:hypothetical protein RSAG8_07128, partial [Rhizoctonia solani AG-8 WAC10335]